MFGKYGFLFLMLVCCFVHSPAQNRSRRTTLLLNGTWAIAEGGMDHVPATFAYSVPVPGLVTLASPAFSGAGPKANYPPTANNLQRSRLVKDTLREAFWYRRTFQVLQAVPASAVLRIAKAMFGARVFLNGHDLGEHLPSFTPGYFDAKPALKRGTNELLIRIGADRGALPRSMPDGFDYEKDRYIPGIYDKVELILSGMPHIASMQVAPDIRTSQITVQVELQSGPLPTSTALRVVVSEKDSKKTVGVVTKQVTLAPNEDSNKLTVSVPVADMKLWSPESPFLYNLRVTTDADEAECRFGMREFYMDTITKQARLNGKPYFMRGSNITLLRFLEDSACGALPWNSSWVRSLYKDFKKFHWNSLRYCIGFPPEEWYDIADEEGVLVQDEFPIWYGGKTWSTWPKELAAGELATEYREWMRAHWNHPSVVIWDASNETYSEGEELAKAVKLVRGLDLSNRPWDNSYSALREAGDVFESHPYHFQNPLFRLEDITKENWKPQGNERHNDGSHAVIINEYGWLWLNRDGKPTTLTRQLYKNLLGENASLAQRRRVYAQYLAAETEFWRCHRTVAGVLHFTALGYSRDSGQTSDHFLNAAALKWEPEFLKYVPDAFSPVGLMLDEWGNGLPAGKPHTFTIFTINDLETDWRGLVELRVMRGTTMLAKSQKSVFVPGFGATTLKLDCVMPQTKGTYTVEAVLKMGQSKEVKSIRELPVF